MRLESFSRICHYCGESVNTAHFYSHFMCYECRRARRKLEAKGRLLPVPLIPHTSIKQYRFGRRVPMETKAKVCEMFIGEKMEMNEIAKLTDLHFVTISKIISQYFGDGRPVLMEIGE